MPNQSKFLDRLFSLFGARTVNNFPVPDSIASLKRPRKQVYTLPERTPLSELWHFFLQENYDTYDTLRNRRNRYEDLDFMIKNQPIIQMAADLYADEATQCENAGAPVKVNAASPVRKEIEQLFERWGIDQQTVRECIWNKVVFGDSFDTNDIDEKEGIVQVTPITVWSVHDRIEFNPSKLIEQLRYYQNNDGFGNAGKLQALMSNLEREDGNPSGLFNKYLLAFELEGGHMVSPWSVTHYRTFSMLREFEPWGRSQFINILPAFRQLMSAEGLMEVARAAAFPRDLYKVATEPGATTTEKWEAIEEFQEQLDNAGLYEGSRELPSIGSRLIIPKDLVEYEQLSNSLDLDSIADIEYLRDNLIVGTSIPKGYLIVDNGGGWGTSGQSLLQQFKPFGRKVFAHQSDYLAGLADKIKLHFAITGKFQGYDTPFELLMQFPVIEEASDRLQHKASELNYAKDVIETTKDLLGVDVIPADIIKDVLSSMSAIPDEKVNKYVDALMKANDNEEGESEGDNDPMGSDVKDFRKAMRAYGEKALTEDEIKSAYTRARNRWDEQETKDLLIERQLKLKADNQMLEGVGDGVHYHSSFKTSRESNKNRKMFEALSTIDSERKFLRESIVRDSKS